MFHPHVILCPTDFSELSRFAFGIALDLARQHQAAILLLHVADTLGPENLSYGEATSQLQPEAHVCRLEEQLRHFANSADVPVRYLLREGDAVAEIVKVATENACDVIVLATHGRRGLSHLLMGSVAERIVRDAPCAVLIVKNSRATA